MDFTVTVYDKAFDKRGTIGAPTLLVATPRHMQQPTAALTVPANHPRITNLRTPGARCVIGYGGHHLLGGPVMSWQAVGGPNSNITFQIADDYRLVADLLAWPKPAAALTAQTDEYYRITSDAETVIKTIMAANATRAGVPLTVATNAHRGATITASMRFHPTADDVIALAADAGIGITIRQSGAGFVLDCYVSRVYPRVLTVASRVVRDLGYSLAAPEFTRVVVGGRGEGVLRKFRLVIDATAEALWGIVREGFLDATDVEADGSENANLDARGTAFLVANRSKASLSAKLAETATFRYDPSGASASVRVGDLVQVQVEDGLIVEDIIREATLSWSADGPVTVTTVVGESVSATTQFVRALANTQKAVRNQIVGR